MSSPPFPPNADSDLPLPNRWGGLYRSAANKNWDIFLFQKHQQGLNYRFPHEGSKVDNFSGNCFPIWKTNRDPNEIAHLFEDDAIVVLNVGSGALATPLTTQGVHYIDLSNQAMDCWGWIRLYNREFWIVDVVLYYIETQPGENTAQDPITGIQNGPGINRWTIAGRIHHQITRVDTRPTA